MLAFNNSEPLWRPKNLTHIIDLLDFPRCLPINYIGNKNLCGYLLFVIQVGSMWFLPINLK
jgi:hypothetical protein